MLNHVYVQAERDLVGDLEDKMRTELQKQQKRLREKLAQIAGPDEVEAHDKEQSEARSKRKSGALAGVCNVAKVEKTQGISALETALDPSQQTNHVGGMTNEQLAHELLLDPSFVLQDKVCMPYSLRPRFASF